MPETDGGVLGARARSASDASVLRRKGHLKEQDLLIEFLLSMHHTHTSLEAMQKLERWINEHRQARSPRACSSWHRLGTVPLLLHALAAVFCSSLSS